MGAPDPTLAATRPEPVERCGVCRWPLECRAQWRACDDLSLVANMTSRPRRALHAIDVSTRTGLAGRHGTREEEVDRLLRGGVFVDLYRAVRQGVRAAVESYSITRLEPLYGFGDLRFERSRRDPAPRARSMIDRFRFPPQDHQFRR